MALLIVLLILFLLAILPVGVELQYDGAVKLALRAGPLKIGILPAKPKDEKKQKKEKKGKEKKKKNKKKDKKKDGKKDKKKQAADDTAQKPSAGGTVEAALPLVRVAVDALQRFRHMLLFHDLTVYVTYGASDAASAAIGYGQAWAAVGIVTPLIDRVFHIRHRDYQVRLDYAQTELLIFIHAHITIFVWQILSFAVVYGIRALRAFLRLRKALHPADGQKTEKSRKNAKKEKDGADS